MNIKKIEEFDALSFVDLTGKLRVVRGCSLLKLEEFSAIHTLLLREIKSATDNTPTLTIQNLYTTNTFFAQMCLRALELCNVDPAGIDLNMMSQLLFRFTYQGHVCEGLLVQLNFPTPQPSESDDSTSVPGEDQKPKKLATWEDMLATLWSATDSLEQTLNAANTMSWNKLYKTLESRSEMMSEAAKQSRKDAGIIDKKEEEEEIFKAYQEYIAKQSANDAINTDFVPSDPFKNIDEWSSLDKNLK